MSRSGVDGYLSSKNGTVQQHRPVLTIPLIRRPPEEG